MRLWTSGMGLLAGMALAWWLGAAPSWAQAARAGQSPASPVVVDADGQVLGPVEGWGGLGSVDIGVRAGGRVIRLLIYDVTLANQGIAPLFDAAGPGPGGVLRGAAGPEDFKTIRAQWDDPQPGCNSLPAPVLMVVAPTVTVLDPATLALPLRLR